MGSRQPDAGAQAQRRPRAGRPQQDRAGRRAGCRNRRPLDGVDPLRVATRTISGLHDGATTMELDELSIRTAAALVERGAELQPPRRPPAGHVHRRRRWPTRTSTRSRSRSPSAHRRADRRRHRRAGRPPRPQAQRRDRPPARPLFEYFGLRTVYDRYLLRHPSDALVIETPQYFFMRVACGLSTTAEEAIELYRLISSLDYLPATPTLFNSARRTRRCQSCYLLDSPPDTPRVHLRPLQGRRPAVQVRRRHRHRLSTACARRGSLIRGTNGLSNGIVPWLKTLDSSVAAVNQGGKRKGAACVYLETWHADIEEFLELRDNTGDEARRTHNLNLANWVPDLFMERVEKDWTWSLFDPKKVPHLTDLLRRGVRAGLRRGREPAGCTSARSRRAQLYAQDDAHARPDRQRLDDVQGPVQRALQPDRRPRRRATRRAPLEPLHRDPRGHERGRDGGVQPRLDQPRPLRRRDPTVRRFDFDRLGERARTAVPLPRSRDRHQLLPDRRAAAVERPLAPGRARRDGPAGRVLPAAPAVRLRRRPASSRARISEEIYFHALSASMRSCRVEQGAHPALRRDPRRAGAICSSTCGASTPDRHGPLGRRCGTGSPSTACATRC